MILLSIVILIVFVYTIARSVYDPYIEYYKTQNGYTVIIWYDSDEGRKCIILGD